MVEKDFEFPGMHHDEHVVLFRRQHWVILARKLARYIFLAIVPFVVFELLRLAGIGLTIDLGTASGAIAILTVSTIFLILWLMFFHDWLDYFLDAFILTNERIVRIEQKGFFDRTVADIRLDKIQDVSVEIKGLLATFLKFGTIFLQSAGERDLFSFQNMPHPELIKAQILTYTSKTPAEHGRPPTLPAAPATGPMTSTSSTLPPTEKTTQG